MENKLPLQQLDVEDVLMHLPVAAFIVSVTDYTISFINHAAAELFNQVEILHQSIYTFFSENENLPKELKQTVTTGKPYTFQYSSQQNFLQLDCLFKPLHDVNKKVVALICTCTEAASQKKTLEKITESKSNLNATIAQIPVGICILKGKDFIVESANAKYLEVVDRKEEAFVGKSLFETIPEVRAAVEPLLIGVLETGTPYYGNEFMVYLNRYGNKEAAYFNFVYQPLKEQNDIITGVIVVAYEVTQIVESKQALTESEHKFREVIIESPIAMTIFRGPDFIIESPNKTLLEGVWQRELEEVENKKLLDVFPELEDQQFPKLLKAVFNTGIPYSEKEAIAYVDVNASLKKYYLDFEYNPLFEKDGSVSAIMVTVNDVTDKVEARQKIQESEQRLLLANEAAAMGTFDWDLLNQQFMQSDRVAQIFGYVNNNNISHQDLIQKFHPEDKHVRDAAIARSIEDGSLIYEARIVWDDKSIHWIRVYGKVVYSKEKQPQRMYGTVVDVTAYKTSMLALEESENKLNIAIDATELGTFDITIQEEAMNCSSKYLEIYGFKTTDKPTRKDVINRIHPDDVKERASAMEQAIKTGILDHETRVIHPDGSIHWIRVKGKMVYDKNNQPERILGTVRDITKDKNATQELYENQERLNIAIESAELGTWELNLETREGKFSTKYLDILGFDAGANPSHEELLSKVHPEDLALRNSRMQYAVDISGKLDYEMRLVVSPNIHKWIKVKGKVFYRKDGKAEKVLGTILDITEQKNSFLALEESEERFKMIANSAPVMIWMSGTDNFSDFFNTSWLNFTGKTIEQEIGDGWLNDLHPDDVDACIKQYEKSFNARESFNIEYRLKRHDGTYRWISDNAVPRYTSNGDFVGYISACMDIDDARKFSEQLQQRELLFKTISNASPVGLWMTDKDAKNVFVNDTWIEWTGMPMKEQLGMGWLDKVIDEDKQNSIELFKQAFNNKEKYSTEFRIFTYNGSIRWCLTEGSPYYDINNEFAGYAGSVTDITERKMVEKELEEKVIKRTAELKRSEEANFRMVNEVEDYSIILLNKEGIIANWNKGAEKIKGYSSDEIIGKHFSTFYTASDKQLSLPDKLIEQAAVTGRSAQEGWRVKKDGNLFWGSVVITALHDDLDNVIGFSKVTRDLTERKIAEEQLEEKSADLQKAILALEKSNNELEQFAYIASHDLQEPLRKIQFFIERIHKAVPEVDDSTAIYFEKIKKSTVRMNLLIRDLLDFSRLSQTNDQYVAVDLNNIFSNIKSDLELMIHQKKAVIEIDNLPTIEAIPLQMQQLFYNLLSNALKFSQENIDAHITVKCILLTASDVVTKFPNLETKSNFYLISIKDNGIGFDQQYAEKIFVIFQRLNDLYTYGGTGIGLALCKKIILNHHGEIYAESKENEGSTFHILLPEKQQ